MLTVGRLKEVLNQDFLSSNMEMRFVNDSQDVEINSIILEKQRDENGNVCGLRLYFTDKE